MKINKTAKKNNEEILFFKVITPAKKSLFRKKSMKLFHKNKVTKAPNQSINKIKS